MEQNNVLILLGRLIQITLGGTLAGCSFAWSTRHYYRGVMATAGTLGICVVLLGALSLYLRINRHHKNSIEARLYWILLSLDILAITSCLVAPIGILAYGRWYRRGFEGTFLIPILASYICAILLMVFMILTIREWRRLSRVEMKEPFEDQYGPKGGDFEGYNLSEQHHVYHHICHHICPVHEGKIGNPEREKSFETTARWSGVSGATEDMPNIMAVTGPPTREPSKKAPSYKTHDDNGSKN